MNNLPQSVTFADHDLKVINHQNDIWFTAEDIGISLNYDHPRIAVNKIYLRNKEELDDYSVETKLVSSDGKEYLTRIYNEEGVMLISMRSHQPKARQFRQWAVRILKAYRHGQIPVPPDHMIITKDKYIQLMDERLELIELRHALEPKWTKIEKEELETIVHLKEQGYPTKKIATRLGRSPSGIRSAYKRYQNKLDLKQGVQ